MGSQKLSAKQNKRFLLLFLEKEENTTTRSFFGASPQTTWVGFAGSWYHSYVFCHFY
jgi:hypothetical protein